MVPINFAEVLNEKKIDLEFKDSICSNMESTLDNYYKIITSILRELQDDPDDNKMGFLVDFMCKNADPMDPGVRDHASYTRFDYVEKCSQALSHGALIYCQLVTLASSPLFYYFLFSNSDAAYCEMKLAEAIKYEKLLFRKLDRNYGAMGTVGLSTQQVIPVTSRTMKQMVSWLTLNVATLKSLLFFSSQSPSTLKSLT